MDFIFEEDMDEVGSDIEAYCPKCKADTSHTVITKYEDEIRRVQCSPCGDVHSYRKPRGEVEEDTPEPASAKKRAAAKKPTWQEAMDRLGSKAQAHSRPYSIRDTYDEGDVVSHPKFGLGIVTEISENKVEVTFSDERRVLVHNRPDLASQMPAIASMPAPRERGKKGKMKKGKKGAMMAPPPPPPPPPAAKGKKGAALPAAPAPVLAKPAVAIGKKGAAPAPIAAVAKGKVVDKVERAKAVATKKSAAKGKPAPAAKPTAAKKPAPRPAGRAARPSRPTHPARGAASKPKKLKAGKKR